MTSQKQGYYSDRERCERELAQRCVDVTARRVHLELAERYRVLAEIPPQVA